MSTNAEATLEELNNTDRGVLVLKQTLGTDFIQSLYSFFRLSEIHDPANEVFKRALSDAHKALSTWIMIPEFKKLKLSLSGDQIFMNDVRIRPKPRSIEKTRYMLQFLRKRRIVGFTIERQPSPESLETFLWGLYRSSKGSAAQLEQELSDKGFTEYKIETLNWKKNLTGSEIQSLAASIYQQLHAFAKLCFENFEEALEIKPPALSALFDSLQNVDEGDLVSIFCMNQTRRDDRTLATIATNSSFMLFAWAKSLGLPSGVYLELAGAGLAHPLALIHKPKEAPLDILTFERSNLALSNLQRIKKVWPLSDLQKLAILEWSVPFGKKGVYEIGNQKCYQHFFSRMLRIVALFQQMLHLRQDLLPGEAIAKLLTSDMGCDQTLVRFFVHWLGIYPVGSFVRLSSGELGQICSAGTDLLTTRRPNVSVYKDGQGQMLDEPKIIDMNEVEGDHFALAIESTLTARETAIPPEKLRLLTSMIGVSLSS